MTWFLPIAALTVLAIYMFNLFAKGDIPTLIRSLRWILGGSALAIALLLLVGGRIGVASLFGFIASSILMRGRLGPIDFTTTHTAPGAKSSVRSRYFEMQMDLASEEVAGKIITGNFAGRKLESIDENEMRVLLREVEGDPDSLSLLETWLNVNRTGWREYFAGNQQEQHSAETNSTLMDEHQAYDILGLKPGANFEEIKAAHHRLLKAVHPDQGGSNFLAARINAAKDLLLKNR